MLRCASTHTLLFVLLMAAPGLQAQNKPAPGQQSFAACAGCHGLDGAGGEHAPNIATDSRIQNLSDAALLKIIRQGIPSAGMPAFAKILSDSQIQDTLAYLRVLQGKQTASAPLPGNFEAGRSLYFGRAACVQCHSINGRGGFLGTDLTDYGKTHTAAQIREAILAPDKNLDPRHSAVTVTTRAGVTYQGMLRNEDNFSVQMQTPDGVFHSLEKTSLTRLVHENRSLMPSDYAQKLSSAEIDDLVKFLSGGATSVKSKPADGDDEDE